MEYNNCLELIRKTIEEEDGAFLLVTGKRIEDDKIDTRLSLTGDVTFVLETLFRVCENNKILRKLVIDTADILTTRDRAAHPETEAIKSHLAQVLDMREHYPEATAPLQLLENHFKGLISCLRPNTAG